MIIYNETWLNNLRLHHQFEDDHDAGCITGQELKLLKEKYPVGFYMPGIIIRIGLFILTFIIVFFSAGLISLFLSEARIIDNFGWPLFLGIGGYFILETMVKQKYYYQSGVDEALLWISASLLTGGFVWMLDTFSHHNQISFTVVSLFIFALSLYLTLRFADLMMSAIACLSCLAVVFYTWKGFGTLGMATLPFGMMLSSGILYYAMLHMGKNANAIYYNRCINVAQVVGLLILYSSGNYFIVNELSNQLTGAAPGTPLAFGFIFWLWTMLLPFVYIGFGIKNKDTILIRTGLLLIAGAIFTFRYYYHVLPTEGAFTIGGVVMLAVSYAVIKYLKIPKNGFTYAEPNRKNMMDQLNIESLIIGETFSQTPTGPTASASPFGGGSAGGGGSSSNY